jgi:FkbM family methyltransferase
MNSKIARAGDTGLDFREGLIASRSLVLYGAGGAGRSLARRLRARGFSVAAFLDVAAAPGEIREGLPVYTLADWVKANDVDGSDVIVSIHNHYVDVAPILDTLRSSGFGRVMSMVDYVNLFPDDPDERYWLAPSTYYTDKHDLITRARALLFDDLSRVWFDAALRLRREGDYHALPAPRPEQQYIPADLPRWPEPMRLIDCGAYDGDTIQLLLDNSYDLEAVIALEPEKDNYAKLAARFEDLNAVFLPCGVSSSAGLAQFHGGLGESSRIGEIGETTIQCVSIDEALPSFAPTLIKMDIEGAEPAALSGAEQTLRRHRPGLAIAIYHRPQHLWEIPLWLAERSFGYKMYLRGHYHTGFDLILYCRAD